MRYFYNILIAVDQLVNVLLLGEPDETISARCWRLRAIKPYGTLVYVINKLFFDPNHCCNSYLAEVQRKQLAKEYSNK